MTRHSTATLVYTHSRQNNQAVFYISIFRLSLLRKEKEKGEEMRSFVAGSNSSVWNMHLNKNGWWKSESSALFRRVIAWRGRSASSLKFHFLAAADALPTCRQRETRNFARLGKNRNAGCGAASASPRPRRSSEEPGSPGYVPIMRTGVAKIWS